MPSKQAYLTACAHSPGRDADAARSSGGEHHDYASALGLLDQTAIVEPSISRHAYHEDC